MRVEEYQKLALRTESPCVDVINRMMGTQIADAAISPVAIRNIRIMHAALGLASDIHELLDHTDKINEIEEVGDVLWYVAICFEALDSDIATAFQSESNSGGCRANMGRPALNAKLARIAATIADKAKASAFYGKTEVGNMSMDQFLRAWLRELVITINVYCKSFLDLEIGDIMERNIGKLRSRYPDKFTVEAALNRDTEAERAAIHQQVVGAVDPAGPATNDMDLERKSIKASLEG